MVVLRKNTSQLIKFKFAGLIIPLYHWHEWSKAKPSTHNAGPTITYFIVLLFYYVDTLSINHGSAQKECFNYFIQLEHLIKDKIIELQIYNTKCHCISHTHISLWDDYNMELQNECKADIRVHSGPIKGDGVTVYLWLLENCYHFVLRTAAFSFSQTIANITHNCPYALAFHLQLNKCNICYSLDVSWCSLPCFYFSWPWPHLGQLILSTWLIWMLQPRNWPSEVYA